MTNTTILYLLIIIEATTLITVIISSYLFSKSISSIATTLKYIKYDTQSLVAVDENQNDFEYSKIISK